MVLIRLSARHKIAGLGTVVFLVVLLLVFTTIEVPDDTDLAKDEPASKAETLATQSYEPATRDDCIETIESTIPTGTTTSETEEATRKPETVEETTDVVDETTTDSDEEPVEKDLYIQHYTEQDAIDIAKVLYNECRDIPSKTEQACVVWTILNRVDCYNSTVYLVVRAPNQFVFYENTPVRNELIDLAHDVLGRWNREKNGETNVGRVLPKEYIYFGGNNGHNYFRDNYGGSYNLWDYSLESPYEN